MLESVMIEPEEVSMKEVEGNSIEACFWHGWNCFFKYLRVLNTV